MQGLLRNLVDKSGFKTRNYSSEQTDCNALRLIFSSHNFSFVNSICFVRPYALLKWEIGEG